MHGYAQRVAPKFSITSSAPFWHPLRRRCVWTLAAPMPESALAPSWMVRRALFLCVAHYLGIEAYNIPVLPQQLKCSIAFQLTRETAISPRDGGSYRFQMYCTPLPWSTPPPNPPGLELSLTTLMGTTSTMVPLVIIVVPLNEISNTSLSS